ncbi:MAG: membrane dipeptidase [Gemmatimonadales bacterium]
MAPAQRIERRRFVQGLAAGAAAVGLANPSETMASERLQQARSLVVDGLDTSIVNTGFLALLEQGGVDCVHKSMGDAASYASMYAFLAHHRETIVPAFTVREIRQAQRTGRRSMVFGVQHANLIEAKVPKDPTGTYDQVRSELRAHYDLGMRIHGICYNVANVFGAGCMEPQGPLTRAGRRLVEEIHGMRVLLDVGGHTGERTSLDALELSAGVPVVCTHTNVAALNPNARASSDRVFEAIAKTGGVVGVTAISDFHMRSARTYRAHGPVSPQATLDVHLDQYDYLKRLIGADHVGLGPDFVWGWGESYDHRAEQSITFPPEALSNGPAVTVKDYEDISKLPNLARGLRGRGWSPAEIDKLMGENWLRVYERVWGA